MKNNKDIVIIGGGLTGLTLAFYLRKAGKNVMILEKQNRTGGVIHSYSENGFTFEAGPSTGVIGTTEIAGLFEDLNGECEIQIADKSAKKRYILKNNRWEPLPSGLISAIRTPLFTWYDKFRILGEPFRKAGSNPDESVADMVVRRLGRSYLDYAVDPFISGVYAGDPTRLTTRHALPKLYVLEHTYGSFVGGSIKKQKEPKPIGYQKVTRDIFSFDGGLESLIRALTNQIGKANITTGVIETRIEPSDNGFNIEYNTSDGNKEQMKTQKLITTVGGYALPGLLPFLTEQEISPFEGMSYSPVIQVAIGYKKWDGMPLDAFGALVPFKENRNILGILFPSAMFAGRAPQGGALLSVFAGGMKNSEMLKLSDEEIQSLVIREIRYTLKINKLPDLIRIFRYQHAIAQYEISTGERLKSIEQIEKKYPGLILAGNIRDGIGMGDRVKQAVQLANHLI